MSNRLERYCWNVLFGLRVTTAVTGLRGEVGPAGPVGNMSKARRLAIIVG
ncbi:hypothetical protein DesfrDRAFT_1217 [Solidesulfovibrio fructosivorans JJ]]|uniref:Uncharacterized protein n=1 Tax=Solidesulfovibrio fructosivorans JJ] TaxID=596151 RepID=E1JUB8_SOLFR|nr:hypothetical protein [Solidesulfovibrio fructosivorans]EFL52048.1 hypothetical protein DesfrDRAFT_1217 [Solidesulfovibrio fructosivorans JJ]]